MYKVVVFGYNFPHKKSENFLHILKKCGIEVVGYLAAPSVKLHLPNKIYKRSISNPPIFHPKELCDLYDIPYFVVTHNSNESLTLIKKLNANLGIISGARILKENIINSFSHGIINLHPGKIPESSGLDSLYWSIQKRVPLYITTHFIDKRIDAGKVIKERLVEINIDDRIEDIKYKCNLIENEELSFICDKYLKDNIIIPKIGLIENVTSNPPMNEDEQNKAISLFESWKNRFGK